MAEFGGNVTVIANPLTTSARLISEHPLCISFRNDSITCVVHSISSVFDNPFGSEYYLMIAKCIEFPF